jgi:hypothetical protein
MLKPTGFVKKNIQKKALLDGNLIGGMPIVVVERRE